MSENIYYLIAVNFERGNFKNSYLFKNLTESIRYRLGELKVSDDFKSFYMNSCLKEIFEPYLTDQQILSKIEEEFKNYVYTFSGKKKLKVTGENNLEKILNNKKINNLETNIILWQFINENIFVINTNDLYNNDGEQKIKLPDILYNLLKTKIQNNYNLHLFIHGSEYGKGPDVFDIYDNNIEVITFMHESSSSDVFKNLTDSYNNPIELRNKLNEVFENLGYKRLRKEIADLFLPLAIDMQGMHELTKKEGITTTNEIPGKQPLNHYYKEIREDVTNYEESKVENKKQIIYEWERIVNDDINNLLQKHKINSKVPKGLIQAIEESENFSQFQENYYDKENSEFFPEWLEKVVGIFDNKAP
jgi:hypothetical protein